MEKQIKSEFSEEQDRLLVRRRQKERFMAPLNIRTPNVADAMRTKWYGMPPTAAKTYATPARSDTISF